MDGHFIELLNGQNDSENITENNYTTENSNVSDMIQVNMLDMKTAMRQTKNNKITMNYQLT
jgi:hypothetical protein